MPTTDLTAADRAALAAVARHDLYTDARGTLWVWPDGTVAQPATEAMGEAVGRLDAAGLIVHMPAGLRPRWYEITDTGRAILADDTKEAP